MKGLRRASQSHRLASSLNLMKYVSLLQKNLNSRILIAVDLSFFAKSLDMLVAVDRSRRRERVFSAIGEIIDHVL